MQENKDDPSNSKNNDGKINRKEISTNFIILSHNKIINNAEVLYKMAQTTNTVWHMLTLYIIIPCFTN